MLRIHDYDQMHEKRPDRSNGGSIPDHADALATLLETAARRIRAGASAEDAANELLLPVRIACRRV